jgi:hypothetical protein
MTTRSRARTSGSGDSTCGDAAELGFHWALVCGVWGCRSVSAGTGTEQKAPGWCGHVADRGDGLVLVANASDW